MDVEILNIKTVSQKSNKHTQVGADDVKLIISPPRLSRNSLIHKALNFISPDNEPKNISDRNLREK